jgi:WD40 repeat protein/tRNA A-37 threonylcarbamoyl transferase component Bud32
MSRCPSEQQLDLFLEERLEAVEARKLSRHVDGCERCQSLLERLTEASEADEPSIVLTPGRASGTDPETRLPADFLLRLRQATPDSFAAVSERRSKGSESDRRASSAEPPQVPGYEILGELGRGGMGVVYKARQLKLNRIVALKMIRAGSESEPKDLARFREEAEAVARLQHPNIVQVYDVGESAGRPYFAMEFVNGGSLVQQLHGDPQPIFAAARLVETLAQAVDAVHRQGVVHRDLKPANVLLQQVAAAEPAVPLTPAPRVPTAFVPKITDFGLSKRLDQQSLSGGSIGEVIGTPSYMAPEQASSQTAPVGAAADIYALGAILYEMLTGRPPFKGATTLDTVVQVLHEEPIRPSRFRAKVPRDLETICLKCLEKEPARRYASALELAEDLRRFRRGSPIQARPVGPLEWAWKWARRHPAAAALLLGVLLVTVLGFAGVTWQWRSTAAARDAIDAEKREKEAQREQAELARQMEAEQRQRARAALYYSRIAQSELQWRVNDLAAAEQSLAQCVPAPGQGDRRGWEWHYLRYLYASDLFTWHHDVDAGVRADVAYRPDGRWIAAVLGGHPADAQDKAGELRIWDARTGDVIVSWPLPPTYHCLAFSPDGGRLALGGTDGAVLLWDTKARQEVMRVLPHMQTVGSLAFSPDGRRLASASWDGTAKVLDAQTGETRTTLVGHSGWVHAVAFHPDGKQVATAGEDRSVRIWNAESGKETAVLRGHKSPVYGVAFSPDSKTLVSAGSNGNIKLWELASGRAVQNLTGQAGAAMGVAFNPDGRYFAYGGGDGTVRVWDIDDGVELVVFRGHTAAADAVRFSPDGQRLVSCSAGQGAVKVWDLTRHPERATLARTTPDVEGIAFADGGRQLLSLTVGGKLERWDAASGVLLRQRHLATTNELVSPSVLASFNVAGSLLAARWRDDNRVVKLWDTATGAEVASLRGNRLPVEVVRFRADDQLLATAACDTRAPERPHEVKIWDRTAGEATLSLTGQGRIFNLAFSPDGTRLALAGEHGRVWLRDSVSLRVELELRGNKGDVSALAFSPDGHFLAAGDLDERTVKVWQVVGEGAGQAVLTLAAPPALCDLVFSPDGRRLAGISRDLVKLWDTETGQEVLTLRGAPQRHFDPAFNARVVFSPDGSRLAGSNWDESISIWEAAVQATDGQRSSRQTAHRQAADERAAFWHLQEAEHCLDLNDLFAATFHLKRLVGVDLPDSLKARKERLVARHRHLMATAEPKN